MPPKRITDPNLPFEERVVGSLSRLETMMENLVGNDQEGGKVGDLSKRVRWAERVLYGGWGAVAVIGFLYKVGLLGSIR